jgi:hypothetical protein
MLRILCFAEAAADARLGTALGDRVFAEEGPDWIEPDLLPSRRAWTGLAADTPFTKWTEVKRLSGPRYIGHSPSGPRGSDYAMAHKALTQAARLGLGETEALAVILLRDCDASEDKRTGLYQAATEPRFARLNVVVGVADKMREAWILAGFHPCGEEETERLDAVRAEIGLDPTRQPERLRAPQETDSRHPKRVLRQLTAGDSEREVRCWFEPSLAQLRERGSNCGLAAFLDSLRDRLVPLLLA